MVVVVTICCCFCYCYQFEIPRLRCSDIDIKIIKMNSVGHVQGHFCVDEFGHNCDTILCCFADYLWFQVGFLSHVFQNDRWNTMNYFETHSVDAVCFHWKPSSRVMSVISPLKNNYRNMLIYHTFIRVVCLYGNVKVNLLTHTIAEHLFAIYIRVYYAD